MDLPEVAHPGDFVIFLDFLEQLLVGNNVLEYLGTGSDLFFQGY